MRPHPRKTSKTGWRIRKDRYTGKWEAYNRIRPQYRQFATWRRAVAFVISETYGQHALGALPDGKRVDMRRIPGLAAHEPRGDRWDAGWILLPQRYALGDGALEAIGYRLTAAGWDESFPPDLVESWDRVDCGLGPDW